MIKRLRVPVPVGTAGECFSPESILCADSCSVSVPPPFPLLLQWHIKDPGHSAKSAGGRFHLNTHTPLTQRCRSELTVSSRHSVGTYQGKELTRNSSGNALVQPSQLAESLWTDPGLKSGTGRRELISTLKQTNKQCAGRDQFIQNLLQKSSYSRNKPRPPCSMENWSVSLSDKTI